MNINRTLFSLIFGRTALAALDDLTARATRADRYKVLLDQANRQRSVQRQQNGDVSAKLAATQRELRDVSQRNQALTTAVSDLTTLHAENVRRTRAVTITYTYPPGTDLNAAQADASDALLGYLMDGVALSASDTLTGDLQIQARLTLDTITLQRLDGIIPLSSNDHAAQPLSGEDFLAAAHGAPVYTNDSPISASTQE